MSGLPWGGALAYVKLFDQCNARCNMCLCWQAGPAQKSADRYLRVLRELIEGGARQIRFTGGEPLLYPKLPRLVQEAASHGIRVSVITNGWLLPRRVGELAAAGLAEIVVSVDGPAPVHDAVRGRAGLHERCMRGMSAAKSSGLSLGVNTVLQTATITSLEDLADQLFDDDVCPDWWHLIPVRDDNALIPDDARRGSFPARLQTLAACSERRGVRLVADQAIFEPYVPTGCPVPAQVTYVDAESGEVFGCNMLAYGDRALGNLLDAHLREIYGGNAAQRLVSACIAGQYVSCGRCDPASKQMNLLYIERAGTLGGTLMGGG